jgi:hypothetical protein
LVGVYDDQSTGDEDMKNLVGVHGYATRRDSSGRAWIFVVEGTDAAALGTLTRYGFAVK